MTSLSFHSRAVLCAAVFLSISRNGSAQPFFIHTIPANLPAAKHLAFDTSGNLYVSGGGTVVWKIGSSGVPVIFAGGGGSSANNILATDAAVTAEGIAVDAAGNVYIAEPNASRVRYVSPDGIIHAFAGNAGTGQGFTGDNGPAVNAQLDGPFEVAVGSNGRVFIADSSNNRVRMVQNGVITTVAGNNSNLGYLQAPSAGDGFPATQSSLSSPIWIASDTMGRVYIAEIERIRRFTPGGAITTIAGTGTCGFSGDGGPAAAAQVCYPSGMAVDPDGNVYFAEFLNHRVRMIDTSGIISTVAGIGEQGDSGDIGPALEARLSSPRGLALDSTANIYFTDQLPNSRIRKVSAGTRCPILIPRSAASYGGSPAVDSLAVTTSCSFNATTDVSWVHIGAGSPGSGSGILSFTIDSNPDPFARNGAITIFGEGSSVSFTVRQSAQTCTLGLPSPTVSAPFTTKSFSTTVLSTPYGCGAWTATSDAPWLTITGGIVDQSIREIFYVVSNNPTPQSRTAHVVVGAATRAVVQDASAVAILTPALGSTLPGGATAFTWSAGPANRFLYELATAAGTPITSGFTSSSSVVLSLPAGNIRFRLYYAVDSLWQPNPVEATYAVVPPPVAVGITPPSGNVLSTSMTFTFTDPRGWQDLAIVNVLINKFLDGRNACYVAYAPISATTGTLLLVNDAGDAGGPFQQLNFPSTLTAANSQCSINGTGSSASANGNTLTLTLAITFNAAFSGNRIVNIAARDVGSNNSGWQSMGVWNVPGPPPPGPAVAGVSPTRAQTSTNIYTFNFSNSNGFQDFAVLNVLVNKFLDGRNACYVAFVPTGATSGIVLLVDDAGNAGGPFQQLSIPGTGAVQNSQCTIAGTGSSVSGAGNNLSLTLPITFSGAFSGNQVIYAAGRSNSLNSDWQPIGSVTLP